MSSGVGYLYVSLANGHIAPGSDLSMHYHPVWLVMLDIPIAIPSYTNSNSMAILWHEQINQNQLKFSKHRLKLY